MIRISCILLFLTLISCARESTVNSSSSWNQLSPAEARIIEKGGTEMPFSGEYDKHFEAGVYVCKRCHKLLYHSDSKFNSGCGWPAFDQEIPGAVRHLPDPDGQRTEIRCAHCDGHLGHVFSGEHFTQTNTRHCVNSASLKFIPAAQLDTAIFAGGCFWGVQYLIDQAPGVIFSQVGYTGGHTEHPTYDQVCDHNTGHLEAVLVVYDKEKTDYESLAKLFFEIHDPTQRDGQGPDLGEQYTSAIFTSDSAQIHSSQTLIAELEQKGYKVATKIRPRVPFWPAEGYHQNYYDKKGTQPYCHVRKRRF